MSVRIAIFLAPGFEEIEAVAPLDVFRRANQDVTLCAVAANGARTVTGSRGLRVQCDCTLDELEAGELQVCCFPGGLPGATNLAGNAKVLAAAAAVHARGGFCAAICAAPLVLSAAGLFAADTEYTCYPGIEKRIANGVCTHRFVQRCGRLVTACGPGASVDFAFEILRSAGQGAAVKSIAEGMMVRR